MVGLVSPIQADTAEAALSLATWADCGHSRHLAKRWQPPTGVDRHTVWRTINTSRSTMTTYPSLRHLSQL